MEITEQEKHNLRILGEVISGSALEDTISEDVIDFAVQRKVVTYFYPYLEQIDETKRDVVTSCATECSARFYRLLQVTRYIQTIFKNNNIDTAVLKGIDIARTNSVPEYRSFGDIDLLLLDKSKKEKAVEVLETVGFVQNAEQNSPHHITFSFEPRIELELHTDIARPFESNKMNDRLSEMFAFAGEKLIKKDVLGCEYYTLPEAIDGLYILIHMAQHYFAAGFGIKFLVDWICFWSKDKTDKVFEEYRDLAKQCGLDTFSDAITGVCKEYMNLPEDISEKLFIGPVLENGSLEALMREIIDAGSFGESDKSRLVALGDNSFGGMIREFHHQMKCNYPSASRCFLIWPILWVMSLVVFVRNNKKIRHVNTLSVLKNASKRGNLSQILFP